MRHQVGMSTIKWRYTAFWTTLILLFAVAGAAHREPTVLGIDIGTEYIKVAAVSNNGQVPLGVIINPSSKRKTPTVVAFKRAERLFGDPALNLAFQYPDQAVLRFQPLIGRLYNESHMSDYGFRYFPYNVTSDSSRKTPLISLQTSSPKAGQDPPEVISLSTEEILAQIFSYIKDMAKENAGWYVKDAVVAVPIYYTQSQRAAVLQAADFAKLNVMSLVNDLSAVALKFGIDADVSDFAKKRNVMFVDLGAGSLRLTIVQYAQGGTGHTKKKPVGQLTTKSVVWEERMGGFWITQQLLELFLKAVDSQRPELDVRNNAFLVGRLLKEAERVKVVLSANSNFDANVESLADGYDFKLRVSREDLEALLQPLLDRLEQLVLLAVEKADGVDLKSLHSVVVVGGAVRTPSVQERLKKVLDGVPINLGMNGDDSVCLGATLYAASLSSDFRVKKFNLNDLALYSSTLSIVPPKGNAKELPAAKTIELFDSNEKTPMSRVMTFKRDEDFSFGVFYSDPSQLPHAISPNMSKFEIEGVTKEVLRLRNATKIQVKVTLAIDTSNMVAVQSAELLADHMVEKKEEKPKTKSSEKKDKKGKKDKSNTTSTAESNTTEATTNDTTTGSSDTNDTDATASSPPPPPPPPPPPVYKKVSERVNVKSYRVGDGVPDMSTKTRKASRNRLDDIAERDQKEKERLAALNELETFIFEMNEKLESDDRMHEVSTRKQRAEVQDPLQKASQWLAEVGQDATVSKFKKKLKALKDASAGIQKRLDELSARPDAVWDARSSLRELESGLNEIQKNKPWLTNSEVDAVREKVTAFTSWLDKKTAVQAKLEGHESPAFTSREVKDKMDALSKVFRTLSQKSKPKEADKKKSKEKEKEKEADKKKSKEKEKEKEKKKKGGDKGAEEKKEKKAEKEEKKGKKESETTKKTKKRVHDEL